MSRRCGFGRTAHHKKLYHHLYFQVLCAIVLGVLVGYFYPQFGESMKWLGDLFIKLIKMLIAPIIFCTVVHGIASMEDMKKVGRVGIKALIYFEVMTTLALIVGLIVVNLWQPGAGMNVDVNALDTKAIAAYTVEGRPSRAPSSTSCTSCPPRWSAPSPRARSCRCCSSPCCSASRCSGWANAASRCCGIIDQTAHVFFKIVGIVMKVAPDRRLRRHGLHHRQVRRRHAAVARPADARLLRHLPDLHLPGAGDGRPAARASASSSSSSTSRKSC